MRFIEKLLEGIQSKKEDAQSKKEVKRVKREIDTVYFDMNDYDISTGEYLTRNRISLSEALDRCDIAISMGKSGQKKLSKYDIKGLGLEEEFNRIEDSINYIKRRKEMIAKVYGQSSKEL